MALSQFKPKLAVAPAAEGKSASQRRIRVEGPLEIAARDDYDEHPIRVQFQIVQVPRGEHTEADIKRVHGIGKEVKGKKIWRANVPLGPLQDRACRKDQDGNPGCGDRGTGAEEPVRLRHDHLVR